MRESTADRNKEFRIELYQAIGRLLEAHTIGVFSSAEVTAALKWIAADDVKNSTIGDAFRSPKQAAQQQRVLTICTWEQQVRLLSPLVAYEMIDKEKAARFIHQPLKREIEGGDTQSKALGPVKADYKLILPEELNWLCESEMLDMTQVTEMLKAADSLQELNHVYGVLSVAYTQAFSLQNLRYRSYDAIRKSLINDPSTAELEDTLQSAEKNKLLLREKLQHKFRAEVTRTIRFKLLSGRIDSMLQAAGVGGLPYDPVYRASRTAWSFAALAHSFVVQAQASEPIPQGLSQHPIVAGQGDQKVTSDLAQTFAENVETLNHSFGDFIPRAKNFFKSARDESFGLLPVGGKIHVLHKIDAMRLEFVKQRLGLDSTGFRLLHADTSLLLPPMPSAAELKLVVTVLNAEGVIDTEHPELQVCIPGRLPPDLCAILGASILLATEIGVKYDPNSFSTNAEVTGLRIMAYDAGGPREAFPFSTPIGGRTDMLGRRALSDIDNYQLLGTVLIRSKDFGPYGDLAKSYIAEFKQILAKYGLSEVLKTSWVAKNEAKGDFLASQRHYYDAVLPCTNAWFTWFEANKDAEQQSGIVSDVRNLLDSLGERVNMQRKALINDPRFSDQKRSLFSGLL